MSIQPTYISAHQACWDISVPEVTRLGVRVGNAFNARLVEAADHCNRLNLILYRYESEREQLTSRLADEQKRWASRPQNVVLQATPEQLQENLVTSHLHSQLYLDIESFYLFAEILLGKVAKVIQFYFGMGRSCPLNSHRDLVKNFSQYAVLKSLDVPPDFLEAAKRLTSIVYFRDKYIEHSSPLLDRGDFVMKATQYDDTGRTRMHVRNNLGQGDASEHLPDLVEPIDTYFGLVLNLLATNTAHCGLIPDLENTALYLTFGGS